MKIASLFAGIGGPALAGRWMGWEQKWFAEVDPYASALLARNFPGVPNHGDVKMVDGSRVDYADILTGGFPCQDISYAGKGEGLDGARSGLWSEYARIIDERRRSRPFPYILIENVSALRSRGLDRVLRDLMALGYDAEWHCVPASHVGAHHQRDRIWILAWANTDGPRLEGWLGESMRQCAGEGAARPVGASPPAPGDPERGGWLPEPRVGRVVHGLPKRMDRIRCLGNSIVPQEAYLIFRAIEHYEKQHAE